MRRSGTNEPRLPRLQNYRRLTARRRRERVADVAE
jgi:hypothetical protein